MIHTLHIDTGREWRGGQAQVMNLLVTLADEPELRMSLCAPPGSPLAERAAAAGVEVVALPLRGEMDFASSRSLRRWIAANSVNVVHAHDAHAHTIALRAVRSNLDVKFVVHRRVDFRVKTGWLGKRKYGDRVDSYVAISNGVATVLTECGLPREKIDIIPSGIDVHKFDGEEPGNSIREEFGIPADAPLIGNVAAMVDHKGHVFLVEAMEEVIREIPNAHCLIAGDGPLRAEIEAQIAKSSIPKGQFVVAGWRNDVAQCLREFDVFCLSSHLEGLCTSLLDATLMDLPLVAFGTGGVPDIVRDGETGWLASVCDTSALAACLVNAIQNPDEAKRRAANAKGRTLEVFDVKKTAGLTLELWKRLVMKSSI